MSLNNRVTSRAVRGGQRILAGVGLAVATLAVTQKCGAAAPFIMLSDVAVPSGVSGNGSVIVGTGGVYFYEATPTTGTITNGYHIFRPGNGLDSGFTPVPHSYAPQSASCAVSEDGTQIRGDFVNVAATNAAIAANGPFYTGTTGFNRFSVGSYNLNTGTWTTMSGDGYFDSSQCGTGSDPNGYNGGASATAGLSYPNGLRYPTGYTYNFNTNTRHNYGGTGIAASNFCGVTADGNTAVGWMQTTGYQTRAGKFTWNPAASTFSPTYITYPANGSDAYIGQNNNMGISGDGNWIFGPPVPDEITGGIPDFWRWSAATGLQHLGLPPRPRNDESFGETVTAFPDAISADGSTALVYGRNRTQFPMDGEGYIWKDGPVVNGIRGTYQRFSDFMLSKGAQFDPDTTLRPGEIYQMSSDGTVFVGKAIHSDYRMPLGQGFIFWTGESKWYPTGSGLWSNQDNWSFSQVPTAAGDNALFTAKAIGPSAITLDSDRTVGTVSFSGVNTFTITGSHTLTLQSSTSAPGLVMATGGSHVIAVPVVLGSDVNFVVAPGASVTVGSISAAAGVSPVTTLSGGGTVSFNGEVGAPTTSLNVTGAMVRLSAPGSAASSVVLAEVGAISVAGANSFLKLDAANRPTQLPKVLITSALTVTDGGTVDIANNDIIVHGGSLDALSALVATGLNGSAGLFTGPGITSSIAAADANGQLRYGVGVVQNNIDGGTIYDTFDGQVVGTSDVLVKFTYFGDADLSGGVDDTDFFLTNNGYLNSLSGWLNGDFDYSGAVDDTDFFLLNNGFLNQGAGLRGGGTVPEPGHTALIGSALAGALLPRRRK
jgi:hypothetical protein